MLKLCPNPTFDAQVKITVPGQVAPEPVTIVFKYMPKAEMKDFMERIQGKPDAEVLAEVVLGWSDVDQPFTPANLQLLIDNFPASGGEIMRVFFSEHLESRAKN
jgi:hypothetical protein